MKKLSKMFFLLFIVIFTFSCSSNKVRYTFIPEEKDNKSINVNDLKLLLHLYNEKDILKNILIKTDRGNILYSNEGVFKKKTEFKELELPKDTKSLIIIYNNKKNRIEVKKNYKYLYIEFRGSDLLEIVYTTEKPAFT
ncbi:hypothetical protein [Chryseobacterium sp. MYb328]|uniref:hypothetical protein n=1 Tax=Chryseobacterium sp. MYb328 TaxID=2745231 RepID=UPI0030A31E93